LPVPHLAGYGFEGTALGDLSYRGERLSKAGKALDITIQPPRLAKRSASPSNPTPAVTAEP
jgi:hypothetical protein